MLICYEGEPYSLITTLGKVTGQVTYTINFFEFKALLATRSRTNVTIIATRRQACLVDTQMVTAVSFNIHDY